MKLLLSIPIFFLLWVFSASAGQGMSGNSGNGHSGGGTQPASGTLLAGVADSGTITEGPFNADSEVFTSITYTASWADSATTTTASAIRVRINAQVDAANLKCLLRNASGGIIAITNPAVTNYQSPNNATIDLAFSAPPTITKGTAYILSCIGDNYFWYGIIPATGDNIVTDSGIGGTYAAPVATLSVTNTVDTGSQLSIGLIK